MNVVWVHPEIDLYDYKVFCFHGEPRLIQVDFDRWRNHKRNLYSTDWQILDASLEFPNDLERYIPRPLCLDQMLAFSNVLTRNLPHCRCDYYVSGDRLLFGELTLSHGSGCEKFTPKELDNRLGDLIDLGKVGRVYG